MLTAGADVGVFSYQGSDRIPLVGTKTNLSRTSRLMSGSWTGSKRKPSPRGSCGANTYAHSEYHGRAGCTDERGKLPAGGAG